MPNPIIQLVPRPVRRALRRLSRGEDIPGLVRRYCTGNGIEIGPGRTPYCSGRNTVFLDKHTDNKDGTPNPDIVGDANAIPVEDASFDFLLSSHMLEHSQNTIRTLHEWLRVIRPGGALFLVLPHGDRTFDCHRQKTTLEHHIRDFETLTDEWDRSHIDEITEGWSKGLTACDTADYERQWGARIWDWEFRFRNDVIHFHVWTQDEIVKLLQYLGLAICHVEECVRERPDSFLVVARKPIQES